jgi:hypothetical protein
MSAGEFRSPTRLGAGLSMRDVPSLTALRSLAVRE